MSENTTDRLETIMNTTHHFHTRSKKVENSTRTETTQRTDMGNNGIRKTSVSKTAQEKPPTMQRRTRYICIYVGKNNGIEEINQQPQIESI